MKEVIIWFNLTWPRHLLCTCFSFPFRLRMCSVTGWDSNWGESTEGRRISRPRITIWVVNPVEEWGVERYAIMMVSIDSSHSRWVSCTHKRNLEVTEPITSCAYEFTIGWYLAEKVWLLSSFISWEMKALPLSESVVVFGVSVTWDLRIRYFLKG